MSCEDWTSAYIGNIADINSESYSIKESWDYVNYLDTGNITKNRIDNIEKFNVASDILPSRARRKVKKGDIVYSTVRPNQQHYGIIKKPVRNLLVSTGFAVIRTKEEISSNEFVYWYLSQQHITEFLHTVAEHSTSAYPAIKPSDIGKLELKLPPLLEQKAIARILSSLDDKIELNNRMNKTLEEIAQTLFKRWFVDFEFPDKNGDPYKSSGGKMVDSELGLIPEGWEVTPFSEAIFVNPKRSLHKNSLAKFINMKSVDPFRCRTSNFYDEKYRGSGSKFQNGDILLARITPCLENGKGIIVDFLNEGQIGFGSTEFIVFSENRTSRYHIYWLSRTDDFRSYAISNMTGTSGRQRIECECFSKYLIAVPPKKVDVLFANIIKSIIDKIKLSDIEAKLLNISRETLLPKLMSGEVRVPITEE